MTSEEGSPRRVRLRIGSHDWETLNTHLFPGDLDEHGAALLCGRSEVDGCLNLLVREVVPAVDGVDYVPGQRGYRHLDGAFVTRQLRRAKDSKQVYLAVHNHGGSGRVRFSATDLESHERSYPTLLAVGGQPVGGLVLARGALAGDIWLDQHSRRTIESTVVLGDAWTVLDDGYPTQTVGASRSDSGRFARQALVFGDEGQSRLAQAKVAVVGLGGVGMLLIQALSRLGVGKFVVIDPDKVSVSNLSRLPEATTSDAAGRFGNGLVGRMTRVLGLNEPSLKTELASRVIRRANADALIEAIAGDVADDDVARRLIGCDFIFLAADTMLAREVVNQISYQYMIPTLQVGSKVVVDRRTGAVQDVFGVVRSLGVAPGCLRCNGLIDMARLAEEAVGTAEQRRNQRYVDEPGIDAPSVITLNSVSAGWAANDFMHWATSLGRPSTGYRILRSRPAAPGHPQLVVQEPNVDPQCHICGSADHSVRARGDAADLPTRVRG